MSSGKLKIIWLQNEVKYRQDPKITSTGPAYSPSSTAKHQSHYHSHSGSLGAVLRHKPIKKTLSNRTRDRITAWEFSSDHHSTKQMTEIIFLVRLLTFILHCQLMRLDKTLRSLYIKEVCVCIRILCVNIVGKRNS